MVTGQLPGNVGKTEFEADAFTDIFTRHVIDCEEMTDAVARIPVPMGAVVLGVRAIVTESIATATTCKVGDLADDDGFLTAAAFTPLTAGAMVDSRLLAGAYKAGKAYLSATGQLTATFDVQPTNGKIELDVHFRGYSPVERNEVPHRG